MRLFPREFEELPPHVTQAAFTILTTSWLLMMQRIGVGQFLKAVAQAAIDIVEDDFPD